MLILAAALAAVSAGLDRLIGWGGFGRTKPVIAGALALGAIAALAGFNPIASVTFAIAYMVWRTPGWDIVPGASIDPRGPKEQAMTFLRHSFAQAFVLPAHFAGEPVLPVFLAMLAFALVATALAAYNADGYDEGVDRNATVETLRGLALGALLGASLIL